ncbi:hypothetical protein H8356DRAFT_1365088 [Neocallimastix lanati (nom. inval.)]|nr:hypothetical protein H8356DRAFT_1365088 [Neocallimastix sp. JGI-2020a]
MSTLLIECYFKNKYLVDCLLKHNAIVYIYPIEIVKSLAKKENLHSYSEKPKPNNRSINIDCIGMFN